MYQKGAYIYQKKMYIYYYLIKTLMFIRKFISLYFLFKTYEIKTILNEIYIINADKFFK